MVSLCVYKKDNMWYTCTEMNTYIHLSLQKINRNVFSFNLFLYCKITLFHVNDTFF